MEQLRAAADNGPQARKLLDTLFRSVHNLKATAAANGLTRLATAAHELENVLHELRKQTRHHSIAEGARLFQVQTDLDISDLDRQFQTLKEVLVKNGEVLSTLPSANKEQPGKVNFRILYAAKQMPLELPVAVTIEEVSVDTTTTAASFAQQLSVLEPAFQKLVSELVPIPVDDVLAQAIRAGEATARTTGKEVKFEVRGDATLLNQLPGARIVAPLLHLIRNAVHHGIETRGQVTIEIARRGAQIAITVTDDGRGIDPSLLEQIFQPGFSTATEVSSISGRGVGLDAVKTSIEDLGGTVTVRSTPGEGASFELTLPIRPA